MLYEVITGLPLDGVWEHLSQFVVCVDKDEIVGCIGVEVRGEAALLRSLAVAILVKRNARTGNVRAFRERAHLMEPLHRQLNQHRFRTA